MKVAFTISDPFLIADHRDEFWELIRGPVDLLFCNLRGGPQPDRLGRRGRLCPRNSSPRRKRRADARRQRLDRDASGEVLPIEGVAVEAIDTTGAGDMYAAGLALRHHEWTAPGVRLARLASHAAARIVSQLGARLKRPFTAAEIADLLALKCPVDIPPSGCRWSERTRAG